MTTTSVNKNNGSEDTFRVFRCFYCNVKSLFDLLFVTQKSVLQKKNGITFQWVCLHIYPPQQGVSVLVIRVQHCRSPCSRCHPRGGRASRARSSHCRIYRFSFVLTGSIKGDSCPLLVSISTLAFLTCVNDGARTLTLFIRLFPRLIIVFPHKT